jgi:GNAT superfamily N-acetyltransferase
MIVQVRLATLHDYPSIASIACESQDLHAQAHPTIFRTETPGFTEEHLRSLIEDERSAAYVVEEEGHICGYVFLHAQRASSLDIFQSRMVAEITDIAVTAPARRKGVGQLLFDASLIWARCLNAERLELTVWEFNREAINFYERNGMQAVNQTMSLSLV